jgi:hypothetical protein
MDSYSRTGIVLVGFGLLTFVLGRLLHGIEFESLVWRSPPPLAQAIFSGGIPDQIDLERVLRLLAAMILALFGLVLAIAGESVTRPGPPQLALAAVGLVLLVLVVLGLAIATIRAVRRE